MEPATSKPRGYTAHIPIIIGLQGVHYQAAMDTKHAHGVDWRDVEVMCCLQYVLQLKYRDRIGFTTLRRFVGKRRLIKPGLKRLAALDMVFINQYRPTQLQYGLTKLGQEVLNYYQRRVYLQLRNQERAEKVAVKYKYYNLDELVDRAFSKGVLTEFWLQYLK